MIFRISPTNRVTRLVAAIIVICFSGALISSAPPLALLAAGIGVTAACYQGVQMWRERRDPYDLSRLWETPNAPEQPEEDGKVRTMAFCHRCGASMPTHHSICPQCGVPLGQ